MPADLPEADWRAFRKLREVALERFCEQILHEIGRILSDGKKTSHARYLAAYELIQERDDQMARAFNNPRRSAAVLQLTTLMSLELISREDLQCFTPRTQAVVEALRKPLSRSGGPKSA